MYLVVEGCGPYDRQLAQQFDHAMSRNQMSIKTNSAALLFTPLASALINQSTSELLLVVSLTCRDMGVRVLLIPISSAGFGSMVYKRFSCLRVDDAYGKPQM
jgi:hypothetical protein